MQRRPSAAGSAVRAVAAHPGLTNTNLFIHERGMSILAKPTSVFLNDADRGALPTLYAATQDIPGGSVVGPKGLAEARGYPTLSKRSKNELDPEIGARRLWDLSAESTGVDAASGTHRPPVKW